MAMVSRVSKPLAPCSFPAIFRVASGILLALRRLLTWAVLCQISCHAFSLFPYSLSRILALLLYLMSLQFLSPRSFGEYSTTFLSPPFLSLPSGNLSFLLSFIPQFPSSSFPSPCPPLPLPSPPHSPSSFSSPSPRHVKIDVTDTWQHSTVERHAMVAINNTTAVIHGF